MKKRDESSIAVLWAYYNALGKHDSETMGQYVADDVEFSTPLGHVSGKEALLEAAEKLFPVVEKVVPQEDMAAADPKSERVMIRYEMVCKEPIGTLNTVVLATVRNGLIHRLQLFFDPRPIVQMQETVYGK